MDASLLSALSWDEGAATTAAPSRFGIIRVNAGATPTTITVEKENTRSPASGATVENRWGTQPVVIGAELFTTAYREALASAGLMLMRAWRPPRPRYSIQVEPSSLIALRCRSSDAAGGRMAWVEALEYKPDRRMRGRRGTKPGFFFHASFNLFNLRSDSAITSPTSHNMADAVATQALDWPPVFRSNPALYYPSGTQYSQALAGGLSFSGAFAKQTNKPTAGGLSFSGAFVKQTNKPLPGGLSFSGAFSKMAKKFPSGGLSFSGAFTKQTNKVLSGGLSFTGAVAGAKVALKSLTGGLSFSGAFSKQTNKPLPGGLSFSGALSRRVDRALSGGLSFTGAIAASKITLKLLTGGLSFSGVVARLPIKAFPGGLSFSGGLSRLTNKVLAGGLSFSGAVSKSPRKFFAGAVSFSGVVTRPFQKTVSGGLSFAGTLATQRPKLLSGGLTLSGALGKRIPKSLTGGLSFVGGFSKVKPNLFQVLTATLGFNMGGLAKRIGAEAYWRFEELSGTTFSDSTGNGHTATDSGTPTRGYAGAQDYALSLDHGSYLTVPYSAAMDLANNFSIAGWYKKFGAGSTGAILEKTTDGSTIQYMLGHKNAGVDIVFRAGGADATVAGPTDINTWHFLVGTFDSTNAILYLDGASVAGPIGTTTPTGSAGATIHIGHRQNGTFWFGALDEVMFFPKALTSAEVLELYNARGVRLSTMRGKWLTSGIGPVGDFTKKTMKSFTASIAPAGSGAFFKSFVKAFTGGLTLSGTVTYIKRKGILLAGVVTFGGSIKRQTNKAFAGGIAPIGSISRQTRRFFTASVGFSGALNRLRQKMLSASVGFSGVLTRAIPPIRWVQVTLRATPKLATMFHHLWVMVTARAQSYKPIDIRVKGVPELAYKRGTSIMFEITFTDSNGALYDPDTGTAKMYVKKPDGTYLSAYDRVTGGKPLTYVSQGLYTGVLTLALTDPIGSYEVEAEGKTGILPTLESIKVSVRA